MAGLLGLIKKSHDRDDRDDRDDASMASHDNDSRFQHTDSVIVQRPERVREVGVVANVSYPSSCTIFAKFSDQNGNQIHNHYMF